MQRREVKTNLRDRNSRQRRAEQNNTGKNPRRNGLFLVGPEICGLGGLDGGVYSLIRTGLDLQFPDHGRFTGNFRQKLPVPPIWPDFSSDDQRLSGEFPTLANREFLREIRDSSFRISELLPEIREVPVPLNRGHKVCSCSIPTTPAARI